MDHHDHRDHQDHQDHHDCLDHQDRRDHHDHRDHLDHRDHRDHRDRQYHQDHQKTEAVPLRATARGARPETGSAGRSVDWSDTTTDRPTEEAILQISGAGHWFLEGWIGDHAVDFLVDSGSAVTALSCRFYQTLLKAGAPAGVLRTTEKTVRCQWITDHDFGMLVLHGVIFGSPDGISSFGV